MLSVRTQDTRILLDELRRLLREHGDLAAIDRALAARGAMPGHLRRVMLGRAALRLDRFELILEHLPADRYEFMRRLARRLRPARSLADDIDVLLDSLPDDETDGIDAEEDDGLSALFDDIVPLDDDDPLGPVN